MGHDLSDSRAIFRSRRIGVMVPAGFSSGRPLALTGGTLQAWMTIAGVDLRTIGIFALVGIPYTVKFLWSPLMDRFVPPWMGRRRGWMFMTQTALLVGIAAMAFGNPGAAPWALGATAIFGPEPEIRVPPPKSLQEAVTGPLREFFSRRAAGALLLLIVLYKLGDAYAGTLTTAFLIRGVGFSPTEVGTINKGLGLGSLIVGAMVGGTLMVRLGLYRSLMTFGIFQAVSNLSFMVLSWLGKSYAMLVVTVAFENVCGGMGTAAFVGLLMALCDHRDTAPQYAPLSSLAALGGR